MTTLTTKQSTVCHGEKNPLDCEGARPLKGRKTHEGLHCLPPASRFARAHSQGVNTTSTPIHGTAVQKCTPGPQERLSASAMASRGAVRLFLHRGHIEPSVYDSYHKNIKRHASSDGFEGHVPCRQPTRHRTEAANGTLPPLKKHNRSSRIYLPPEILDCIEGVYHLQ